MNALVVEGFQLSYQQQRFWATQRAYAEHSMQAIFFLEGALDRSALQMSLYDLVSRHEILRTRFDSLPGMSHPLQVVSERVVLNYREISLGEIAEDDRERQIPYIAEAEQTRRFDPSSESPVRFALLVLGPARHALILTTSALCADRVSLHLLMIEIEQRYAASSRGRKDESNPLQYIDYAEWQRGEFERLSKGGTEERHTTNSEDLTGSPFGLPFRREPDNDRPFQPKKISAPLEPSFVGMLVSFGEREGVEFHVPLFTCWRLLLGRITGSKRFWLNVPSDGRTLDVLKNAIGPYTELISVPVTVIPDIEFNEAVRDSQRALKSVAATDSQASTLIDFEFQDNRHHGHIDTVRFLQRSSYCWAERFELRLTAIRTAETNLALEFWFDPRCYDVDDMKCVAQSFANLLRNAVTNPEALVGALPMLSYSDRERLIETWNATDFAGFGNQCLHDLINEQALRHPDLPAVIFGDEALTFEELNQRSNRLAAYLRNLGMGPEEVVAICLRPCVNTIVAVLGVWKAGGAYLFVDDKQPGARSKAVIQEAGARILIAQKGLARKIDVTNITEIDIESDWASLPNASENQPCDAVGPGKLAYVMYTSGSTGRPKGVMIEHHSVVNLSYALNASIYGSLGYARVSVNAPMFFDASIKQLIQLASGRGLVLIPEETRQEPTDLIKYLATREVDVFDCTPSHLRLLLEAGFGGDQPPSIVLVGGEESDIAIWRRMSVEYPKFFNVYGPTECTVDATVSSAHPTLTRPVIGKPIANTRCYVLDGKLHPVPVGITGDLYVSGIGLSRGYLGQPGLTASRFLPNPFSKQPGARLYHTGDRARWLFNGNIEFNGRQDRQVKIRGHRVELGEIEAVLSECPGVNQAAAVLQRETLTVYYTAAPQRPSTKELHDHIASRLPKIMVPDKFIPLDRFPLTRQGKIDRALLPSPEQEQSELPPIEPRTPVEEIVAGIWMELLRQRNIGVNDNFFERGGHSLLATQVVSRLRNGFGVELPLAHMFEAPTIAQLAQRIETSLRRDDWRALHPIRRVDRNRPLPLSFAQQRLWFLDQLNPNSARYNNPYAIRLTARIDVTAIEDVLSRIVNRHEVLRTTFAMHEGKAVQVISPPGQFSLPITDLSALPEQAREQAARKEIVSETGRPFDLSIDYPWRARLLRLAEEDHILVVIMHHVVIDAWSLSLFAKEFAALYDARCKKEECALPELPIQYADFAVWQHEVLAKEILDKQRAYWERQLANMPNFELPHDHPPSSTAESRAGIESVWIAPAIVQALKAIARSEQATLYMVLVAAFNALLRARVNQEDIVIGTDIANRNRSETEQLLGFFVNFLVLRTDASGDPTFRELLQRVRTVAINAYANQDYPYDQLVSLFGARRSTNFSGIFQILFSLQNAPGAGLQLSGLTLSQVKIDTSLNRFEIAFFLKESEQGLHIDCNYSADLFEQHTVTCLLSDYATVLEKVAATPEAAISEVTGRTLLQTIELVMSFNDELDPT